MNTVTISRKMKVKPDFMYTQVYEVPTLLTNIDLSLMVLKLQLENTDHKVYLDIITRSSHRINNVINQLLLPQNLDEVVLEQISMHQLLDNVLNIVNDRITLKQVTIIKKYAKEDCKMLLDIPKITIALTNIIINALDAMVYGKGTLTIKTKVIDGQCTVQIEDNGCGIAKTNLKYIFKPYYSNKPGGLGLGLSTTNTILKASKIGINVRSVVSEGTSFMLQFNNAIAI